MRCLVTGAAGFLGSHLTDRLLADGHTVVGLDNFLTGREENLAHLDGVQGDGADARFELIRHDVVDPWPAMGGRFDRIYNLACPASPPHYQADPVKTTLTSVLGVHNGLLRAKQDNARFLQASTSEVYGDPEVHPQPETYRGSVSTTGIRACYDEGKRCAESLCCDHARMHGTETRIARIFNTYGPRMDPKDGRVVSNFIVQALRGQPLTVYGDGSQTRSICYVTDLIDGLVRLMEHPEDPGPVNLGATNEMTMLELADLVRRVVGRDDVNIIHLPLPADDPKRRDPVLDKARSTLGYGPRVTPADGIALTTEHFRALD